MSKGTVGTADFEKICRLCMGSKRSLVDIFSVKKKADSTVPLDQKILSCTSLSMYEGDCLPGKICLKCVQAVNMSYALRLQAEKVDADLRRILELAQQPATDDTSNRMDEKVCKFEPGAATIYEDVNGQAQIKNEIIIDCNDESPATVDECIVEIDSFSEEDTNIVEHTTSNGHDDAELSEPQTDDEKTEEVNEGEPETKRARCASVAAHFALALLSKQAGLTITKSSRPKENDVQRKLKKSVPRSDSKDEEEVTEYMARRNLITQKIKELGKKMDGNKYYCQECKIFIGSAYFYNHVKFVHVKVRDHLCEDCGYRAQTGHILRQHIDALHTDHTYPCDHCERTFRSVKSARDHMRSVHMQAKERAHICQFCGKGFFTGHYLRNHIRTHTQETPYKCQYCDRRFSFKWPCTTHERLHTGVKPYKCSFCPEAFTQNCVRKNHEYRAHGNEEFNPKNRKPRVGNLREKKKNKIKIDPTELLAVSMSNETSSTLS